MNERDYDFSFKDLFVPLTTLKVIHFIFIIGFIVYFYSLFNGFAWDDLPFIINNQEIHQLDFSSLLGPSLANTATSYRPIPVIYIASLYSLFGQHAFFYHLIQLILHLVVTSLLFLFFRSFFTNSISFFLALVFLVHPINVESVAYISSSLSELYFIPGMTALLLAQKQNLSRLRIVAIITLLFIGIMAKETGFLFILLFILYRCLFKPNKIKQVIFSTGAIITLYFLLRVGIGNATYSMDPADSSIAALSLTERILNIPAIIFYYVKTFLFPLHLAIWQQWVIRSLTFENFILPLLLISILFIALLSIAYYLWRKNKHHKFLFFFLWFVLGLGLVLQLVPLDMTVADRWFYFPIVGVLGLAGIGLQTFLRSYPKQKRIYLAIAVILISLLSLRTIIREFDWKDNLTLYRHDLAEQPQNAVLMDQLAITLYNNKKTDEALMYAKRSVSLSPNYLNLYNLGMIFTGAKQYNEGISAYSRAIQTAHTSPGNKLKTPPKLMRRGKLYLMKKADGFLFKSYVSLAVTYIRVGQYANAIVIIEEGIKMFPASSDLYLFLTHAEYKTGNARKALAAARKSYELSPNKINTSIYNSLKQGLPIKLSITQGN